MIPPAYTLHLDIFVRAQPRRCDGEQVVVIKDRKQHLVIVKD